MSFGVGNGSAVDIDSAGGFLAVAYGKCIEIIICIALYRAGFQREDSVCALQVNRCGSCSAAVGIGDYTCCTVRTVGNGNIRAGVELQRIPSGTRKPETCKVNLNLIIDSDFAACFNIRSETNGFAAFSGFDRCGQLGCITDGDYFFLVIFRICIVIIAEAIFFIGILFKISSLTLSGNDLVISVSIYPGATTLIFIFLDANSFATDFEKPITPALDAE